MILGMQVTIPGPESLTMPEFQPLWAWIGAAVGFVYAVAVVLFRVTGKGWQIYNQQVEGNKWRDWASEKPIEGSWFCFEDGKFWWQRQGDEARKWTENETRTMNSFSSSRWRYATYCGHGDSPLLAVFAGLVFSPLEYFFWIPAKNATWIASLPLIGIANFAKGGPPKPKVDKEPQTIFEAMEKQNKELQIQVEQMTALLGNLPADPCPQFGNAQPSGTRG